MTNQTTTTAPTPRPFGTPLGTWVPGHATYKARPSERERVLEQALAAIVHEQRREVRDQRITEARALLAERQEAA